MDRGDHVERERERDFFSKEKNLEDSIRENQSRFHEEFFSSTIESSVRISPPGKISSIELEILSHGSEE